MTLYVKGATNKTKKWEILRDEDGSFHAWRGEHYCGTVVEGITFAYVPGYNLPQELEQEFLRARRQYR